jgi:hypothetical protein
MRSYEEIQRAHDQLLPLITGDIPFPLAEEDRRHLHACLDVLCWVLEHNHNQAFAVNLDRLGADLHAAGFELKRAAKPFTHATRPPGAF